jgi:hypothetical protein
MTDAWDPFHAHIYTSTASETLRRRSNFTWNCKQKKGTGDLVDVILL